MVQENGEQERQIEENKVRLLKVVPAGVPDPEVKEQPTVRRFTTEYKARILQEADQCRHGELGALARREGIYVGTIAKWRKQRDQAIQEWLEPQKPGRKPQEPNPLEDRVAQLEKENARLQQRLKQAETIIEVQKKISEILAIPLNPTESEKSD
jgi:transposase-like protein